MSQESILVDKNGTAKISLFSFGRIIAAIPSAVTLTASVGPILPFRWMSPELLINNDKPTTESDMWAVGCVSFWVRTVSVIIFISDRYYGRRFSLASDHIRVTFATILLELRVYAASRPAQSLT